MIDLRDLEKDQEKKDRFLTQTTNIATSEDLDPIFNKLVYEAVTKPANRLFATVLNSILTQERAVFILTRDDLVPVYKADTNHIWSPKGPVSFGNGTAYKLMRKMLQFDYKIASLVYESEDKSKGQIFEVIDQEMLDYLIECGVDVDAQRADCIAYVKGEYTNSRQDLHDTIGKAVYSSATDDFVPPAPSFAKTEPTQEPVELVVTPESPTKPEQVTSPITELSAEKKRLKAEFDEAIDVLVLPIHTRPSREPAYARMKAVATVRDVARYLYPMATNLEQWVSDVLSSAETIARSAEVVVCFEQGYTSNGEEKRLDYHKDIVTTGTRNLTEFVTLGPSCRLLQAVQ